MRPIPSPIMNTFHSETRMGAHFTYPSGIAGSTYPSGTAGSTYPSGMAGSTYPSSGTSETTYPSGSSELHSPLDFIDSSDEYVPHLPPPIITSYEDNMKEDPIEVTSSHEDSASNLLAQNNQKVKKKSTEKQCKKIDEKFYPITEVFNPLFLDEKKKESSSRPNFVLQLWFEAFLKEK